jgi:hypothetical protein
MSRDINGRTNICGVKHPPVMMMGTSGCRIRNHTFVWTYVIGGGDGISQRQWLTWGHFSWDDYSQVHNDLDFLV